MIRKPYRQTMTSDIARLRELAAAGVSLRAASLQLGLHPETARYWQRQFGLGFRARHAPLHPALADLAIARLARTMGRLAAALPGGRP